MRWLVVRTLSGAEWTAHRALLNRGIESYLPSRLAEIRHGRWAQPVLKAQFPNYLFVLPGRLLEVVRSTTGVHCLLHQGSELLSVSSAEMARIRQRCETMFSASLPARLQVRELAIGDIIPAPIAFGSIPVEIIAIDSHNRITAQLGRLTLTFSVDDAVHQSVPNRAQPARNLLRKIA
jgi:hypothetical protein